MKRMNKLAISLAMSLAIVVIAILLRPTKAHAGGQPGHLFVITTDALASAFPGTNLIMGWKPDCTNYTYYATNSTGNGFAGDLFNCPAAEIIYGSGRLTTWLSGTNACQFTGTNIWTYYLYSGNVLVKSGNLTVPANGWVETYWDVTWDSIDHGVTWSTNHTTACPY